MHPYELIYNGPLPPRYRLERVWGGEGRVYLLELRATATEYGRLCRNLVAAAAVRRRALGRLSDCEKLTALQGDLREMRKAAVLVNRLIAKFSDKNCSKDS